MNKDVFFRLTTSAGPRKTFCVLMRNRTSDFKFLPKKRADLRPPKHKCISAGTTISISNHNSARTNSPIVYSMQIIIHCKKKKNWSYISHFFFFFQFQLSVATETEIASGGSHLECVKITEEIPPWPFTVEWPAAFVSINANCFS